MPISRRGLLKGGAVLTAASFLPGTAARGPEDLREAPAAQDVLNKVKSIRDRIRPITVEEFQGRIQLAQRFMTEAKPKFDALYVTPGSTLLYLTGIRWSLSERLLALAIPRKGVPVIICPAFEESRLRELLRWPIEVRSWQEDENPSMLVARWFAERGIRSGRIGIEETTRYTFFNALRRAAPALEYASGDPITVGCRAQKTEHELELMQLACEATCDVFKSAFASLREGMTQRDIASLVSQGFQQGGLAGGALVLLGAAAAQPHGTSQQQELKEGDVVLMDGGTSVEGYASDVTRCTVLGKPSQKLKRAFEVVRQAQDAALAAAVRGRPAGSVDDAARAVITAAGYGSNYQRFTHRVGHGIGLDGHEHPYLVRGTKTTLEPGMTFSNEPGIYVPGEFGLRLEDDMAVQEIGPARLLTPGFSASLENPCG